MKRRGRSLSVFLVIGSFMALLGFGFLRAQKIPGLGSIKKKLDKFSINRLLEGEPPVSTSLSDAVTEVPFLDDFNPPEPAPMTFLPRAGNGDFVLVRPGAFQFTAASYCLHAGTHAPSQGDGYLYAPLKGTRSEIIRHILENSVFRPDIAQQDIQRLIWAIIAKTKFTKMPRPLQLAGTKLLTAAEVTALSGGSLDTVSEAVLDKAMEEAGLPAPVRDVLRAEARIRSLMTQADADYAELERAAVLSGAPPPGEGSRLVPGGRWSFHPDGYFIRYVPHSYSRTDIEISVPRRFKVERDAAGRIASISDDGGSRIAFEYGTAAAAPLASGTPLKAHALKAVRYSGVHPWHLDQKVEGSWAGTGWTLAGFPGGTDVPKTALPAFASAQARIDRVRDVHSCLTGLSKVSRDPAAFMPADRESLCLEIASLCDGLKDIISTGDALEKRPGNDAYAFVKTAWQAAILGRVGSGEFPSGPAGYHPGTWESVEGAWPELTLGRAGRGPWSGLVPNGPSQSGSDGSGQGGSGASFGTATPGNTSRQRLGESARPYNPGCQATINIDKGDVKINGKSVTDRTVSGSDLEGATISTGRKGRVEIVLPEGSSVRLGANSQVTMPQDICQRAKAAIESKANMQILMDAGVIYSTPAPRTNFEIKTSNAVDGVRGDLRKFVHGPGDRILLASLGGVPQEAIQEAAVEAVYNEMRPDEAELAAYQNAFFVACARDSYHYVRVDRGTVEVTDSKGSSVTLKAGEHLFVRLAPAPPLSARKDMFTRTARSK
jgi:FecR protein